MKPLTSKLPVQLSLNSLTLQALGCICNTQAFYGSNSNILNLSEHCGCASVRQNLYFTDSANCLHTNHSKRRYEYI